MNSKTNLPHVQRILATLILWSILAQSAFAATPPVIRSTEYNDTYSDVVHYPNAPWMNSSSPNMTIEAWVYARNLTGRKAIASRNYQDNLYFGLDDNQLIFYHSGGASTRSSATVPRLRWTHVAVSYDGSNARFYINGVGAGISSLAHTGTTSTNGLSIGGQRDLNFADVFLGVFHAFDGYLDEIRIWSTTRSQSLIASGMNQETRSSSGLLATFGSGGQLNDITSQTGASSGTPVSDRWSGFGILPANLCIPRRNDNNLVVDGSIDLLNEYRGAETIILRSSTSATARDYPAYLMVSAGSASDHLFVGVPNLAQAATPPYFPTVLVSADTTVDGNPAVAQGDWQCELVQDGFQGGRIFDIRPPFFTSPSWIGWNQSDSNWQGATASSFEFQQSYEFRIHASHLNNFGGDVGLLVRYTDFNASGDQLVAPKGGTLHSPLTYSRARWCGEANVNQSIVNVSGSVSNVTDNVGVAGRNVNLWSGESELSGFLVATTTTDSSGEFNFAGVSVPRESPITITYNPPGGSIIFLDPHVGTGSSTINSPTSVRFSTCSCTYSGLNFRYRVPGPLAITGVSPSVIEVPVTVRTSPLKTTPGTETITLSGANFHNGVRVYFRGSGCSLLPPDSCSRDFEEANLISVAEDGRSLVAQVPTTLDRVEAVARVFQIVVKDPSFTGANRWNYGPNVQVNPPSYPLLHGFEFENTDGGPSLEEFEACYGESIFTGIPFPPFKVRDPYYYAFFFPIYMAWMEIANGSCSGMAATSRLMANGTIPNDEYDRPDNGEGVHGVLFANGYPGVRDRSVARLSFLPLAPPAWSGFDLFKPFEAIDVWGRVTSFQGAQTSAEFLNHWLGQLGRPIISGPRRGICVGNPNEVLSRVRSDVRRNLIVLGGREFQSLHTVTPYGIIDDQGLADDLLTPTPRTGCSLIQVYDNNWATQERLIEVNRTENTFRYRMWVRNDGTTNLVEGAGLFHLPVSIFENARHAPGPHDIAANLHHFLRVLHTGTASTTIRDNAGGVAGWSPTDLENTYSGALPMLPPGALPNVPDRFDRTMFFLPSTNPPVAADFVSAGSNVVIHYALGDGEIAYGFRASAPGAGGTVHGIVTSKQSLQGLGLRTLTPVDSFSALVSSRGEDRQSRVWRLDADTGSVPPDMHIQRDGFSSLKILNQSSGPLSYSVTLSGYDKTLGVIELSSDTLIQPGNSTVTLLSRETGPERGFIVELDTNNDGTTDSTEIVPARGVLRPSRDGGSLALRWRPMAESETLESSPQVQPPAWSQVNTPIRSEGPDQVANPPMSAAAQFYRLRAGASEASFRRERPGTRPSPWEFGGLRFTADYPTRLEEPRNTIVNRDLISGLGVTHTVNIVPLNDCDIMHLDVLPGFGPAVFEAIGPFGVVVAREELQGKGLQAVAGPQEMIVVGEKPQRVTLRVFPNRISHVRVISPEGTCMILDVLCETTPIN